MSRFAFYACFALLATLPAAFAQDRGEIGIAAGGSLYRNKTLTNNSQTATAGLSDGIAASFWVGQNLYNFVGGEIRYTYERNDYSLSSGGTNLGFSGDQHVVNYDLLVHFTRRGSRVRPFVFGGGGVKYYRGASVVESANQPLSRFALLTKENQLKPVVSFGGGLKFAVTRNITLRLDVRDYLSGFPTSIITPNAGTGGTGYLHNIVPEGGVAFTF